MNNFELRGLDEAIKNMAGLDQELQDKILRGATSALARDVRDNAKQDAPRAFGTLEENIVVRSRRGRRGQYRASVVVREEGSRGDASNAFYWRFQEFGYFLRDGVTWMPGAHFITIAYESLRGRLDNILKSYIGQRFDKALSKK